MHLHTVELQLQRVVAFSPERAQTLRDHSIGYLWLLHGANPGQLPVSVHDWMLAGGDPTAASTILNAAYTAVQYDRVLSCLE